MKKISVLTLLLILISFTGYSQDHQTDKEAKIAKQHFDKAYGLNAPENYERYFVPVIAEPLAKDLIGQAELLPGERVLDVACGTGIIARLALQKVGDSGTVAGLDINPGMLAVARSISKDTSIEWYEASAESMPLPDSSFDVVLSQLGLQFMEDKTAVLKEMHRVLVPEGRLILNVAGSAGRAMAILAEAMERHISLEAGGFVRQVFSLHDAAELQKLMNSADFREIDIKTKNEIFSLPTPKDFLWQYIHSTPLAAAVAKADEEAQAAMEREVVGKWQGLMNGGDFLYEQTIITASARK